jgi:Tol biopolymer transport system component
MKAAISSLAMLLALALAGCSEGGPAASPSPTADDTAMSRIAFVSKRDGNWEIYVMNADGSDRKNISNDPGFDSNPSWSPDGRRIVFFSDRDGDRDIYVMDSNGSNVVRLTDNQAIDHSPAWSPDGEKIAFVSDRDGRPNLWVMNADGTDPANLTPTQVNVRWPGWSPDSSRIVYEFASGIYVIGQDGLDRVRVIRERTDLEGFFVGWPSWSPNGFKVAITLRYALDGSPASLYTVDDDGDNVRPIRTEPGQALEESPGWSPDGRMLVFASTAEGSASDIFVADLETGRRVRLTDHEALDSFPAWEPRGFVPALPPE